MWALPDSLLAEADDIFPPIIQVVTARGVVVAEEILDRDGGWCWMGRDKIKIIKRVDLTARCGGSGIKIRVCFPNGKMLHFRLLGSRVWHVIPGDRFVLEDLVLELDHG